MSEITLPAWTEPKDLASAKAAILSLGRSIHEHAYLVGKLLAWVKAEVGHGNFGPWLNDNVWFNERTARRFMAFASVCDQAGRILDYHPRGKTDTVSDLLPEPDRFSQISQACEMLDRCDEDSEQLKAEVAKLKEIDIDSASRQELTSLIDQARLAANRACEIQIRADRALAELLQ